MSNNIKDFPTKDNSIMKSEQINTRPVFVNKQTAAEMTGVSKSTIYKWLNEAEESGEWPGLSIRPSFTITLVHLATLEQFIRSKDKEFL